MAPTVGIGATTMAAPPLCLNLSDKKQQSMKEHKPLCLEDKVLFAHAGSFKLLADCSRNVCIAASVMAVLGAG